MCLIVLQRNEGGKIQTQTHSKFMNVTKSNKEIPFECVKGVRWNGKNRAIK